MNRLTLHESVAPNLATHDLVEVAAAAQFDSIGLRVAGVPGAAGRWRKGAGTAELRETIDRLLSSRVSVSDIGRAELRTDTDPEELAQSHRSVLDLGVRFGAHWATACPVGPADLGQIEQLFTGFIQECQAYQLVPLLVCQPGTAVDTTARALEVIRNVHGGGVVVDVRIDQSEVEIEAQLVEAGTEVGYLRMFAADLDVVGRSPDAFAGLLATVPPHIPVAISGSASADGPDSTDLPSPSDASDSTDEFDLTGLIEQAVGWRHTIDGMLEHPRARETRLGEGRRSEGRHRLDAGRL